MSKANENLFKPAQGTGDDGYTNLLSRRVPKTHILIKLNAVLDEANAILGIAKAKIAKKNKEKAENLAWLQSLIFKICSMTAGATYALKKLEEEKLELELKTKKLSLLLKPNPSFITPGSSVAKALLHLARAKIRLAEIKAWQASEKESAILLNRMSDYLFLLSL